MAALDTADARKPALDIPALAKETGATFLVTAALAVGLVGFKTRTAIGRWQERNGQTATCFPGDAVLKALR